jgi:hypothetical protein
MTIPPGPPVHEQLRGKVAFALDLDHVSLAVRRFGLAGVGERERIALERRRKHPECQPCKILAAREKQVLSHRSLLLRRLGRAHRSAAGRAKDHRTAAAHHGWGIREVDQVVAIEAAGTRQRVGPQDGHDFLLHELVGQLNGHFEISRRRRRVPADAAGLPRHRERSHGRELLVAAERLADVRQNLAHIHALPERQSARRQHRNNHEMDYAFHRIPNPFHWTTPSSVEVACRWLSSRKEFVKKVKPFGMSDFTARWLASRC